MALTWVWVGMVCMALVYGAATGQSAAVGAAAAQGVQQAVDEVGLPGALTGGLSAASGGVAASLIFAVAAAAVGKSREQS